MSEKELEKLIAKYQQQADAAEEAYQETGAKRYYTTHCTNQDLADALRMALSAKADHDTLRDRDEELEELWEQFGDVPMNPETELHHP